MLGRKEDNHTPLISDVKSGPHFSTVVDAVVLKNNLGEEKLYKGSKGLVVTFLTLDGTKHQELYWLNNSKILKLLLVTKTNIESAEYKELIGKKLWIVIKTKIKLENGKEVSRENEMIDFLSEHKMPNYPLIIEEYEGDLESDEFPDFPNSMYP